jgi:hypothetical protein
VPVYSWGIYGVCRIYEDMPRPGGWGGGGLKLSINYRLKEEGTSTDILQICVHS